MTKISQPRNLLYISYAVFLLVIALVLPRFLDIKLARSIAILSVGLLMIAFNLAHYALMRREGAPPDKLRGELYRLPLGLTAGLAFMCIGVGYLTSLEFFGPLAMGIAIVGIVIGLILEIYKRSAASPPPESTHD